MLEAILHVGTMKTGTTSIQNALKKNSEYLSSHNYKYLGWPLREAEKIAEKLDKLESASSNIIISDEGLWHHLDSKRSDTSNIAKLLSNYKVTVVIYLRRPDSFLNSWFLQGVKTGGGNPNFTKFLNAPFVRSGLEFEKKILRFEKLFGENNIKVRPYERSQLESGDVVTDFLATIGLPKENFIFPKDENVTDFSSDLYLLKSLLRSKNSKSVSQQDKVLNELLEQLASKGFKGDKSLLFTKEELCKLSEEFKPVFLRLQDKFKVGSTPYFFKEWIDCENYKEDNTLRKLQEKLLNFREE